MWRYVTRSGDKKPRKIPYYVDGGVRRGKQGSDDDLRQLVSFERAFAFAQKHNLGMGIAVLPELGVVALDFDSCYDEAGLLHPRVAEIIGSTYAERSPSGKGVRAFFRGALGDHKDGPNDGHTFGFETFSTKGFVTITGDVLDPDDLAGRSIEPLPERVRTYCVERFGEGYDKPKSLEPAPARGEPTPIAEVREALFKMDASCIEPEWFNILAAVHWETQGSAEGLALAIEWSKTSPKFSGERSVRNRWSRFTLDHAEPRTLASLLQGGKPASADDFEDRTQDSPSALSAPSQVEQPVSVPDEAKKVPIASKSEVKASRESPIHAFYAYLPQHQYIYRATGALFPAASVDGNLRGWSSDDLKPSEWLDKHRAVQQMTWDPARGEFIADHVVADGGWVPRQGSSVYNRYRPALDLGGDPAEAAPWVQHVERLYGENAAHIIAWLAHRVQRPGDKINHALVLGGPPGAGKDTLLEPVKIAVGDWNWRDISPPQMLGRFNDWCQAVVVRINEANDTGQEVDRYKFYEHCKQYFASPPGVLRVDEKHTREFPVVNVAGYIITTNAKTGALYLPADDRRHYVAWTNVTRQQMGGDDYFTSMWAWVRGRGAAHVQAYLSRLGLSTFDAKTTPVRTSAFLEMAQAGVSDEEADIDSILETIGRPDALTFAQIMEAAPGLDAAGKLSATNGRKLSHFMARSGYSRIVNPDDKKGRWTLSLDKKVSVFARDDLTPGKQRSAVLKLLNTLKNS